MILDFQEIDNGAVLEADICIIGAGAAGIALAREFLQMRHSVLLLEGGGTETDSRTQALYDSEIVGYPHHGIHRGRARVFGGTTTLWAGQALPLGGIDFRVRPWVADSGWPIGRAELEPYYRRAEKVLGLQPQNYESDFWPAEKKIAFDNSKFQTLSSQFSPRPNFALAYQQQLQRSTNIRVILHANVFRIDLHPGGARVESVKVAAFGGNQGTVIAKYFVVCCGGIETARLFLVSDNINRKGIANELDLVGRFFQDHVQGATLPIRPTSTWLRLMHDSRYVKGIARSSKVALSEEFQEHEGILNATVGVTYDEFVSEHSPVEAAKRLVRAAVHRRSKDLRWADFTRAASSPHRIAEAAYRRFVLRHPASRMEGTPHVGVQLECAPIPSSRVTLSRDTDGLGVRRICLDWQLSPLVMKTAHTAIRSFSAEIERLGLGVCDTSGLETKTLADWGFFDANHHIGTTRMSETAKNGVVDRDCRVHGVDNLFVGSSAVFPTGGHSNPTLTILALVMRISDHLKVRLVSGK